MYKLKFKRRKESRKRLNRIRHKHSRRVRKYGKDYYIHILKHMIRQVMPNLITFDIVSCPPLNIPHGGLVFYKKCRYEGGIGSVEA